MLCLTKCLTSIFKETFLDSCSSQLFDCLMYSCWTSIVSCFAGQQVSPLDGISILPDFHTSLNIMKKSDFYCHTANSFSISIFYIVSWRISTQLNTPLTHQEISFFDSSVSNPSTVMDMRNCLVKKTLLVMINHCQNKWLHKWVDVQPTDGYGSVICDFSVTG